MKDMKLRLDQNETVKTCCEPRLATIVCLLVLNKRNNLKITTGKCLPQIFPGRSFRMHANTVSVHAPFPIHIRIYI